MQSLINDYNILFIIKVDENIRKNAFRTHSENSNVSEEDLEDGYHVMMGKDTSSRALKVLKDVVSNNEELWYAQPIIGPVPSKEEAENIGKELSYILESNPEIRLSEAIFLWDHQFNLTDTEEKKRKKSLN